MTKDKKYILSFSGGKDSTVMLWLAIQNKIKLDEVICAVLDFEEKDMIQHLKNVDDYYFKNTGKRIIFLKNDKCIKPYMTERTKRGKHKGTIRGFPLKNAGFCWISRDWKIRLLEKWQKDYEKTNDCIVHKYLGFALDEKNNLRKRKIENYKNENYKFDYKEKRYDLSLESYPLVDFGYTEEMCRSKLKDIGLWCQTHFDYNRSGCWFCPKSSKESRLKAINSQERLNLIEEYNKISGREIYPDLTLKEILEKYFENKFDFDVFVGKDLSNYYIRQYLSKDNGIERIDYNISSNDYKVKRFINN
jgi:3'-phosphoadenosine 5'-phosphosulfate sulfotransferase (PAPS reductase)/FAD synthetase